MVGARRVDFPSLASQMPQVGLFAIANCKARPRLPDSESGGLLFPANHAPMKLASLTGFAPVISCMRSRRVVWTTPQGQKS